MRDRESWDFLGELIYARLMDIERELVLEAFRRHRTAATRLIAGHREQPNPKKVAGRCGWSLNERGTFGHFCCARWP